MPGVSHYPVPALEKGLDIIEALATAGVPQSLTGLAAKLERSSSELFRMLNCLEQRGYIHRDELSGKYALTLKLYTLAHTHSLAGKLVAAARLPMQGLTEKFRESCHLSVLERRQLLVLAQHESPERVRLSIEVGGLFDPVRTASGRLLLAHLGEAELAAVLAASPTGRELGPRQLGVLKGSFAGIRREGLSTADSETIQGVHDLAVVVGSPAAGIVGALAVTRLTRRDSKPDDAPLIAGMRAAAAEITAALGLA